MVLEIKTLRKKYHRKNGISFAFHAINFANIAELAKKTNQNAVVHIIAQMVSLETLEKEPCIKFLLSEKEVDTNFVSLETQKQADDELLLSTMIFLQEMKPESLSIAVSENANTINFCWEIVVMYYEGVADVFYDCTHKKKDALRYFDSCFE